MAASEAQLVARCREMVRQCQADLDDLRTVCGAASSHKAVCAELLAAGSEAVAALEQLVAAAGADVERCRSAQQLGARVQSALDQAEALAKTYGKKQLLNRFASELLSLMTNQVPLKFDVSITELRNLAKKAQHDAQRPLVAEGSQRREGSAHGRREGSAHGGRASGSVLHASLPLTFTSGSSAIASRGASVAIASRGGSAAIASRGASAAIPSRGGSGTVPGQGSSDAAGEQAAGAAAAAADADPGLQQPARGSQQQLEQQQEEEEEGDELEPGISGMLIPWDELERIRVMRTSEQGQVWLGRWQETDVVIKQLGSLEALGLADTDLQRDESGAVQLGREALQALDAELGLMQETRHPHIILFMGVVLEPPAVVTEHCGRGSLHELLQQARSDAALAQALSWPRRLAMALDAAKGMLYLHGRRPPVVHRSLCSRNLLVSRDWDVKVAEFRLSRDAAAAAGKAEDVHAFGRVLWELLTWQPAAALEGPPPAVPDEQEAMQLPGGMFPALGDYTTLLRRCWAEQPGERPSFEQVAAELRRIAATLPEPEHEPADD